MKKGDIYEGIVKKSLFPSKGVVRVDDSRDVIVKNCVPGQRVRFCISKKRNTKIEGRVTEILEKAPYELKEPSCPHFGRCGGCSYQNIPYAEQLRLKETQVRELLSPVVEDFDDIFEGIIPSPKETKYRNKMELTFGDERKGGPLSLGMHGAGSFYDIIDVDCCRIMSDDFNLIRSATRGYFDLLQIPYYHRLRHDGYLRHLVLRRGEFTGENFVCLVTADESKLPKEALREEDLLKGWVETLKLLCLDDPIKGIIHVRNNSLADAVIDEGTTALYGEGEFSERLLGLDFTITPFSFFQTNSAGAEVLYGKVREYAAAGTRHENGRMKPVIYDLYSGTGTITQLMAPVADKAIGVEIVEEAVESARRTASRNGLSNCDFICGDVLKALDDIGEKPDFIILDPPRDGIHPKALAKITAYGVENMVYVSCKPTSLARDLASLTQAGYQVQRLCCVDMFPATGGIETVVLLSKGEIPSKKVKVEFSLEGMDTDGFKDGATYDEIRDWVQEKYGIHVTNLNIAQIKRKNGIIERENYNKPKSEDSRQPGTTPEKEKAITEALKHFNMI